MSNVFLVYTIDMNQPSLNKTQSTRLQPHLYNESMSEAEHPGFESFVFAFGYVSFACRCSIAYIVTSKQSLHTSVRKIRVNFKRSIRQSTYRSPFSKISIGQVILYYGPVNARLES